MDLFPQFYVYNKETGQVHATNDRAEAERQLLAVQSRQVGLTTVGASVVSTVFLPIPSFDGMLFETAVNRNDINEWETVDRYQTVEQAKRGHARVVALLKQEQKNNQN